MCESGKMDFDYDVCAYLIAKQARDFHKAAETVSEDLSKPVMVNISFACELYLKALIVWNNKNSRIIREHRLMKLLELIEPKFIEEIIDKSAITGWEEFLSHSSAAFQEWRYYYENNTVLYGHVGKLFVLADVLNKLCEREINVPTQTFE